MENNVKRESKIKVLRSRSSRSKCNTLNNPKIKDWGKCVVQASESRRKDSNPDLAERKDVGEKNSRKAGQKTFNHIPGNKEKLLGCMQDRV